MIWREQHLRDLVKNTVGGRDDFTVSVIQLELVSLFAEVDWLRAEAKRLKSLPKWTGPGPMPETS